MMGLVTTLRTDIQPDSIESHYAECHYAECHYAECHYAECRDYLNGKALACQNEY